MTQVSDPLRPVVSAYAGAYESLATATTGRVRKGPGGTVLAISGVPVASLNAVISVSREPDLAEIASLAESESWALPWSIHVRGEPGPLARRMAARHGLTTIIREPLMIRPARLGIPAGTAEGSLRVRAVAADDLGLYAATLADGLEAPRELLGAFGNPALAQTAGITSYLAELDGLPIGTGMTVISGDLTGIFNIAILPRYRRHGYGRAVTLEMVRAGFAAGAPTAYLYATKAGEPVYESADFRTEEYLTKMME
jgi:N-acetylglutamate synthase